MKALEQFALYQLKNAPETRAFRFCSYQALQEKEIQPWHENYENVYVGMMLQGDTPATIRERFNRKLPKNFKGHSISASDVLVLHSEGKATVYYVEASGFAVIDGFLSNSSSGTRLSHGDRHVRIEGKSGSWYAFDCLTVDQELFFLMEHEQYEKKAAWVVADENGKLVVDNVHNGFDQAVRLQMKEYVEQKRSPKMERTKNNGIAETLQGRPSVLAKLRRKQKEIAAKATTGNSM